MRDLEELKESWRKAKIDPSRLEADNRRTADRLASTKESVNRAQFNQFKLATDYWRAFVVSVIGTILAVLYTPVLVLRMDIPVWLCALVAVFFVVMAFINLSFYRFVYNIHFADLPVVTGLMKAFQIIRRHKILALTRLALSLVLIAFLAVQLYIRSEEAERVPAPYIAGIVAAIIAIVITAALKYRRQFAFARAIKSELSSILSNN